MCVCYFQNARAIFFQEENSVDSRDPLKDLKKHTQVCDEFRTILSKIKAIKDKWPPSDKDVIFPTCILNLKLIFSFNDIAY